MAQRICNVEGCTRSADRSDGGKMGLCGAHYMDAYRKRVTEGEGSTPGGTDDGSSEGEGNPDDGQTEGVPSDGQGQGQGDGLPSRPGDDEGEGQGQGQGDGEGGGEGEGEAQGQGDGEGDGEGEGEGEGEESSAPERPEAPGIEGREKTDMDKAWETMGESIGRETEEQERVKWTDYADAVEADLKAKDEANKVLAKAVKDLANGEGSGGFKYTPGEFGDLKIPKKLPPVHYSFRDVLAEFAIGENVALVGPAGSGKTSSIKMAADILNLKYYSHGAVYSKGETLGYLDAKGDRAITALYRWATDPDGGILNMDEMDGSLPKALTPLHEVLDNRRIEFPGGVEVELTDKHLAACCMNTWGNGGSRMYVGRNRLDAATLDRFVSIEVGYDGKFEKAIFGYNHEDKYTERRREWIDDCQITREAVENLKLEHLVSMRATRRGVAAIEIGQKLSAARKKRFLFSALDAGQITQIRNEIKRIEVARAAAAASSGEEAPTAMGDM